MKTYSKALSVAVVVFFLLIIPGCSAKTEAQIPNKTQQAGAISHTASVTNGLASFGFHIFAEPVTLPSFSVLKLDGSTLSSTELAGTITLLNFWATWCPPCRAAMPGIERLQEQMKAYDFRITAISVGERRASVEKFISDNRYTFPVYIDERNQLGRTFASQGIPTTYVVNKQGLIIAGIVGSIEYDDPKLIRIFQELSAL